MLTENTRPPATRAWLPRGYRLFEYQIEDMLGQGGFGIAYAATDVHLNSKVVIKEYLPQDLAYRTSDGSIAARYLEDDEFYQAGLDSFLVEARTLATFRHPNVVRVARFFEANSTGYMVLEYEEGQSLRDWRVGHGDTPEAELVSLFGPLLEGLEEVHRAGYLHRDIKPDNIYVRSADGSLVLLDFGSARQMVSYKRERGHALTPGYAAVEQYGGTEQQGPWTDIYALGATLYWLITGQKPLDSPMRVGETDPQPKASVVRQGRYSEAFLGAIDAALRPLAADRPQSVAEFRTALFSGQASALGLQAALDRSVESGTRARWSRPADWPIATILAVAMIITALLPMLITTYVNHNRSVERLGAAEIQNLRLLAKSTAARVSQLLAESAHVAAFLARDDDFVAHLQSPAAPRVAAKVASVLAGIVKANPDVLSVALLDSKGVAVASTGGAVIEPARADPGQAGASFTSPVTDPSGAILGAVMLRLKDRAITAIVESAREDNPALVALLVDENGILFHHADPRHLYKSLAPLSPEKLQQIARERGLPSANIVSLGMPELARHLMGAKNEGTVGYVSPITGKEEIAGYAPVKGRNWVVALTETRETFAAPLTQLYYKVLASILIVGVLFVFIIRRIALRIVRPVQELTAAAHALKSGDYDRATVPVTSKNEIGQLARVFNVMIDVLRQRERERSRKKQG